MIRRPPMFPPTPARSFPLMNASFPTQPIQPRPGLGGFLARLFSRGQPAPPVPHGFMMPTLQNAATNVAANTGGGLGGILTNVQRMLGIAQNVVPMVQQYGPLVKNIPAMMKIWKELKTTNEEENEENEEKEEKEEKQEKKKKTSSSVKRDIPTAKATDREKTTKEPKPSKPKLYI
ncbi:YqfQ family protein [Thermaerobacillus caldiproteolyticus]|uniref:Sec-independent protein translocase protein TatA n=1 Tax=Thermaerobacillus caldiproteolyticus TaxID=247480 RepID=A0A7V9Z3S3_9BACL|nr:YqfQ family protein [Anoxybacillus caldiproteolyticus]MBA2873507.1 Sec-independent protein translocase protein TatA [Anoxybacillus caldiproteolyticus]